MRSTCAGNIDNMLSVVREWVTRTRARQTLVCALPCGGESIGFATVTIDHTHATHLSDVVCLPLRAWLEPLPLVVLSWMPNRVNGAVFTLAWDIYHLPLYDVGSKRHWDKQCVKRCSGLTLGLCETLVVLFTAWSCFPSWGNEFP